MELLGLNLNNEHTCGRNLKNKYVTTKWLAKKFESYLKNDPNWSKASFDQEVRKLATGDVSIWKFRGLET